MRGRQSQSLRIADNGKIVDLDYAGALASHEGESWFGVAVGFRMLQAAGEALSEHCLWDRKDLFVVSGHPGGGVRDAVEYVTRCVSRKHFSVRNADPELGCSRTMTFAWEVGNGVNVAALRLRDNFVPETLYELLDRRGTPDQRPDDASRFATLKRHLAEQVWDEPLAALFNRVLLEAGVVGHA